MYSLQPSSNAVENANEAGEVFATSLKRKRRAFNDMHSRTPFACASGLCAGFLTGQIHMAEIKCGRKPLMSRVNTSILLLVTMATIGTEARAEEGGMSSLVEGNSQFAVDLYGRLRSQPGNLFFSPSSISTALAMTYAGARGETAEQMARVLHFPPPQDKLPEAFQALHAGCLPQDSEESRLPFERGQPAMGAAGLSLPARFPGGHPRLLPRRACRSRLSSATPSLPARRSTSGSRPANPGEDQRPGPAQGALVLEQAGAHQRDLLQGRLDQAVPQVRDPGRSISRFQRQDHDRAPDAQDRRFQVRGC